MKYRSYRSRMGEFLFFILIISAVLILIPRMSMAYPDAEILGPSSVDPPFDFGVTATYTGFLLIDDSRLIVSYSDKLKLIDMGSYALEAEQPPDLNTDDETDGNLMGLGYDKSRNQIIASQDDGDILFYELGNITNIPVSVTLVEDNTLGPVVVDPNELYAYVADNTDQTILVVNLETKELSHTINLSIVGQNTFQVTDGVFVEPASEAYFTTNVGTMFYFASAAETASTSLIADGKDLPALGLFPSDEFLYIVDKDTPVIIRYRIEDHSIIKNDIDISANTNPTDVIVTTVRNPSGAYGYVAGANGISVIDTEDDTVFDLGDDPNVDEEPLPTSETPYTLASSSSTDGFVYMGFETGKMGILSESPWVVIPSITYSSGGSSLSSGESFTLTFTSTIDGTYELQVGAAVDAGGILQANGAVLTDENGATSGSVTADTDTPVTVNYDDNSTALDEGANDVWVFVTTDTVRGRRASTVTVDTPPPDVTIVSTGFGNGKIYVTFNRIDKSDIAVYRFYVDTDSNAALTKTDIYQELAQASSGSTMKADISGLENGTLYYVAMEAVDDAGNISPSRAITSETPAETFGPTDILGEKGCALIVSEGGMLGIILFMTFIGLAFVSRCIWRRKLLRSSIPVLIGLAILFSSSVVCAQHNDIQEQEVSPHGDAWKSGSHQMWEFEIKTGFWMPKNSVLNRIFTPCCNLISRFQGGLLFQKRYGIGIGIGFLYKTGRQIATGAHEGELSQDRFTFILVPMETNFTWRMDYFTWRYFIPYIRVGADYVFFKEGANGGSTKGVKFGGHGTGGLQINIGNISGTSTELDGLYGINDLFITLEGQYQWIDSFGSGGLDLSGPVFSIGLLMEF